LYATSFRQSHYKRSVVAEELGRSTSFSSHPVIDCHGSDVAAYDLHELLPHGYKPAALVSLILLLVFPLLLLVRSRSSTATARASRDQLLSKLPSPPGKLSHHRPPATRRLPASRLPPSPRSQIKHDRDGLMLLSPHHHWVLSTYC
jgi:hypothetical protein